MSNAIVQVAVSQTVAPAASTLQRTGALISLGGTTLGAGNTGLLTQYADLTPLLATAKTLSNLVWASSVVTATATVPHGYTIGEVVSLTITGATPAGYNGTFLATITTTTAFTYPLAINPGTATIFGSVAVEEAAELVAMATTWFAQGTTASVLVLELGAIDTIDAITALNTYIVANPQTIYSFLVPRAWAAASSFLSFLASYENPEAMTYFFVTATNTGPGAYTNFTNLMKCVYAVIEAPGIPATEFSAAAFMYVTINYNPSTTNMVTPNAFAFLYGVTPYPTKGNAALFATWKAAFVNWVGTGAEGGISNTMVLWGTTMDGNPFNYWFSVDWVQINLNLDLSNEIINGSNNPQAPLYYDQNGINRLQARAQGTMNRGVTYGLVLPPVAVTAVPFAAYVLTNESDYPNGVYNGLAVIYTPRRGFESILFNVQVSDIPTA